MLFLIFQALVGISFSLGFILGPLIGAMFSLWSNKTDQNWFVYPALCALMLSLADLIFIVTMFKETLPKVLNRIILRNFVVCKMLKEN